MDSENRKPLPAEIGEDEKREKEESVSDKTPSEPSAKTQDSQPAWWGNNQFAAGRNPEYDEHWMMWKTLR